MNLNDTRVFNANRATVCAAILDAEVLKACSFGCLQMEGTPEKGFTASVMQKVG